MWESDFSSSVEVKLDPLHCIESVYSVPDGRLAVVSKIEQVKGSVTVIKLYHLISGEIEQTIDSDLPFQSSSLVSLMTSSLCLPVTGHFFYIDENQGVISHGVKGEDGKSFVLLTNEKHVIFVSKE